MSAFEMVKEETIKAIRYAERNSSTNDGDMSSKNAITWAILALAEAIYETNKKKEGANE